MNNLAYKTYEHLLEKGYRISAAESCTGGLFAKYITDIPGSASVLDVSIVTYANEAKIKFLGVSEENIKSYGVVSEAVAKEMASGVRKLMNANVGIGITGIAGPGGGTPEKPVGTVWTAIDIDGEIYAEKLSLNGDRETVREATCNAVFERLVSLLEKQKKY